MTEVPIEMVAAAQEAILAHPFFEGDNAAVAFGFANAALKAALAASNQEAWVAALLNAPNPAATPDSSDALTGAALGRWCYENPNLAALTIEGFRAATPAVGGERKVLFNLVEAVECEIDVDARSLAFRNRFADAKAALAAQPASPLRGRMLDQANYKMGGWLAAALEDPNVCAEMKADIGAWFEAHQPGLIVCTCGGDLKQLPAHHDISCPASLSTPPPEQPAAAPEVQFLLDRLEEYDPEEEDHVRDFHGHVAPAIARLRNAVTSTSDDMISVNRETDFQVSPIKSDGETKA